MRCLQCSRSMSVGAVGLFALSTTSGVLRALVLYKTSAAVVGEDVAVQWREV